MKNSISLLFVLVLIVTSCGPSDKKAELEQLKNEREALSMEINKLEAELLASGADSITDDQKKATLVEVATVKEAPFIHYISVQGRVVSDKNVMLTAKAAGTITKISVDEGQSVRKGQVLAQIDPDLINRSITELETSMDLANTLYERQKNLWEQNIGTEVQYLQAKNSKESLENRMASLNEQLQQTRITAPFNGVIDDILIKEGEVAAPGTPAVRIVSPSDFKIRAEIAENYISVVDRGNGVTIELPNYDTPIRSAISSVSKVIDPANRTFQVEVSLPDSVGKGIKANMVAYINVEDYESAQAVVIPINAVQFSDEGDDYVFIAEDNKAVMRPIKIGKTYNNEAEVLSGLKPGEKIVITGHRNLVDDQAIAHND